MSDEFGGYGADIHGFDPYLHTRNKQQAVDEAARILSEMDAERGHDRQTPLAESFRPVTTNTDGLLSLKLPVLLFQNGERVGVVLNLYTHPDNGVIFDAEIRWEDGVVESWRGKNMRGRFFIGEYAGSCGG